MAKLTPEQEQRRFRIPERDKLERQHAPKIERALQEQLDVLVNDSLTAEEIAQAPNRVDDASAELEAALLAFALAMASVGVDAAQDDLAEIALAIDQAEADTQAKRRARERVADALTQLNTTTRNALMAALPVWLVTELRSVDDLRDELAPVFNRARADSIARTEGTSGFARGVEAVAAVVGVAEMQWYTMRDERVCHICKPMNGKRRPINGTYDIMLPVTHPPPAHPRCRCGELMVTRTIG